MKWLCIDSLSLSISLCFCYCFFFHWIILSANARICYSFFFPFENMFQIQHPRSHLNRFDLVVTPRHDYYPLTPHAQKQIPWFLRRWVTPRESPGKNVVSILVEKYLYRCWYLIEKIWWLTHLATTYYYYCFTIIYEAYKFLVMSVRFSLLELFIKPIHLHLGVLLLLGSMSWHHFPNLCFWLILEALQVIN